MRVCNDSGANPDPAARLDAPSGGGLVPRVASEPRSGETPRRVVRTPIAMRLFERLDSDRNGTITKKELPRESVFNRLDSDRNGLITKEEVEQLRRQ